MAPLPTRVRLGGSRLEQVAETGAERPVVDGAAGLEQQMGAAPGPAHLLRLGHAPVGQEVGRVLGQRRPNPQAGPVPLAPRAGAAWTHEPVEDRWVRHARVGQDEAQAGAAVGERGQLGVTGAAHGVEGAPDQRHDVGAGVCDGAEHLSAASGRLGVADAHLSGAARPRSNCG